MGLIYFPRSGGGELAASVGAVVMLTEALFDPRMAISPADFIADRVRLVYLVDRRLPVRVDIESSSFEFQMVEAPTVCFSSGPTSLWLNVDQVRSIEHHPVWSGGSSKLDLFLPDESVLEAWGQLSLEDLRFATRDEPTTWSELMSGLEGWRLRVRQ